MPEEKRKMNKTLSFFGKIGWHYDFLVTIAKLHVWGSIVYLEGTDRSGRNVLLRVPDEGEQVDVDTGETVVVRGKVSAHDTLFEVPFTLIEATSGIEKL
jgi:hypothetical protein